YDSLLTAGKKAFDEKRYDDAVKLLGDATALMPGDAAGTALLRQAQQQQLATKTATDKAAKTKADFAQAVKLGQDLLAAKKYDDALAQFKAANTLIPNDPTVLRLIKQAEAGRNNAALDADKAKKKAAFDQAIKLGQ